MCFVLCSLYNMYTDGFHVDRFSPKVILALQTHHAAHHLSSTQLTRVPPLYTVSLSADEVIYKTLQVSSSSAFG